MEQAHTELLGQGIAALGVPECERVTDLMRRYLEEIEKWNPRYGLVSAAGEELVVKHVLDSLAAWRVIEALGRTTEARDAGAAAFPGAGPGGQPGGTAVPGAAPPGRTAVPAVLDVGSGAGLPGIPLAAALPGLSFTLLERSSRRAVFLQSCALILGLSNVRVVEADLGRADAAAHGIAEQVFDVVTFRAVAPLGRFLDDLDRSGLLWRAIAAYKGKAARAAEELKGIGEWAPRARVERLTVPYLEDERCLVVITARPAAWPAA